MSLQETLMPPKKPAAMKKQNVMTFEQWKKSRRLEIATTLLQGKIIKAPRAGYDPGGFYQSEVHETVKAALDFAEELIDQNERYGETEEDFNDEVPIDGVSLTQD